MSKITQKGRETFVIGTHWDSYFSTEYLLEKLDSVQPKLLVLGDLHPHSHLYYKYFNTPKLYNATPQISINKIEDLPIREKFKNYFAKEFRQSRIIFVDEIGVFYIADNKRHYCIADSELSAAYWGCEDNKAGVLAGGAHPLVVHEDLIASLSLEELKEMFYSCIEKHLHMFSSLGRVPPEDVTEFYYYVRKKARESFPQLTHKRNLYTASLVNEAAKSSDKVAVLYDHFECQRLKEVLEGEVPRFGSVYSDTEYSGSFEDLIEKVVILSHIDNRVFRNFIEEGGNPLKVMFGGNYYRDLSEVRAAFAHYNQEYSKVLTESYQKDISRIAYLSQRGRQLLPTYKQAKLIEPREPNFITGLVHKQIQNKFILKTLLKKVEHNISRKEAAGISQEKEILALKQLSEGKHSAYNIEVFKRLLAEANYQLKLTPMPASLKKYKKFMIPGVTPQKLLELSSGISVKSKLKDDHYRSSYLFDPNNPPKPFKRAYQFQEQEEQKQQPTMEELLAKGYKPETFQIGTDKFGNLDPRGLKELKKRFAKTSSKEDKSDEETDY